MNEKYPAIYYFLSNNDSLIDCDLTHERESYRTLVGKQSASVRDKEFVRKVRVWVHVCVWERTSGGKRVVRNGPCDSKESDKSPRRTSLKEKPSTSWEGGHPTPSVDRRRRRHCIRSACSEQGNHCPMPYHRVERRGK